MTRNALRWYHRMVPKRSTAASIQSEQVVVRLTPDLLRRVDAYRAVMQREFPGMRLTRSDAVREVLARGLKVVEKEKR